MSNVWDIRLSCLFSDRLMLKSGSELSEQMIMLIKNFELLENMRLDVMRT